MFLLENSPLHLSGHIFTEPILYSFIVLLMSAECVFSSDTDSLCLLSFFFCFVSLVRGFLPHCSFQRTSTLLHWFSLLFLCSHFIDFCFYLYYTWPLNNVEATGAYPSPSQKSTYNFTVGPSHQGSASTDSTNHRFYSTIVHIFEKNLYVSGPTQFKPMLFKGQFFFSFCLMILGLFCSFSRFLRWELR